MFETSRRTHPLHTFRFWFVVIAAAAVTVAWKFDLLPVRIGPAETGQYAQETFTEVDPLDEQVATSADDEVALPFDESNDSLNVPTIAPSAADNQADDLRQTAAVVPVSLFDAQSEPTASDENMPTETGPRSSGPFDEGDWPTDRSLKDAAPQRVTATPATEMADDFPHAAGIVPTNATSTVFESPAASDVRTAQNPFLTEDVTAHPPTSTSGIDFSEIDRLLASGLTADEIDAHRQLSTIYWKQPEAREALRERIDKLAQQIYFLGSRHYMAAYQVQPGDMLQDIARQYDISWQYLAKLNRVDPKRVRAGQRLKVIKGPFSAIVDLSDYELTVHAHGYYVTRYPVGIGKDGSSPIGKFAVQEKLIDPTYYGPNGVINHDDPANPLGERWIDIGNSYGIHGTIDPASIGKNESQGCIRLHNDDVNAVYDLLTIGSEVVIRP